MKIKVTADVLSECVEDACNGVCVGCGEIAYGSVEPDAERYECERCQRRSVYGIEQAVLLGLIEVTP